MLSAEDQCRLFGLEVVGGGDEMDWENGQDSQDDCDKATYHSV